MVVVITLWGSIIFKHTGELLDQVEQLEKSLVNDAIEFGIKLRNARDVSVFRQFNQLFYTAAGHAELDNFIAALQRQGIYKISKELFS